MALLFRCVAAIEKAQLSGTRGGSMFRNATSYEEFKTCNFLELLFCGNAHCSTGHSCRPRWRPR